MVDPRFFAPADIAGQYQRGVAFSEQRRAAVDERERKQRLGDLLPGAAKGDQAAIDQLYQVDPEIAMRMDDRQRKQAQEELGDLTAAVRWADNPEKWQYVQQHFGQKGVDLSGYQFGDRERGLLALGQLGKYLESQPKPEYRTIEAGGSLIDVSNGNPRVVIAPNDGSQPMGAPAQSGLAPGKVVNGFRYKGGNPNDQSSWEPVNGGPTPQASGGFPY